MANFLTFEENQVLINDYLFPANSVSLQMNANTVPVKDIYGNLLYYSPTGPIQGTIGLNFFLTGALPSYFRLENQDETPIKIAFNNIVIPDCYLTNLSFSVKPFEPIPVRADLIFYHGIRALNTDPLILNEPRPKFPANNIAYSNSLFNSSLNTLMGTASYILTNDRSSFSENSADFIVTDFDYQFSVERVPVLRVGDTFPLRVAMKEANAEFTITSNNLDGYLDIHGNTAIFSAVLRDTTQLNVYDDSISLTGIIVDQSYEISEDNYGLSKIKMIQALNRKRMPVTIPMEVSNPNIVTPPTVNTANPIVIPGSTVITPETVENEKPNPVDPEKGTVVMPQIESDNDTYYWYVMVIDLKFYATGPNMASKNYVTFQINFPLYKGNFDTYYYFYVTSDTGNSVIYLDQQKSEGIPINAYVKENALVVKFRVNKAFKESFNQSSLYTFYQNSPFFIFKFRAQTLVSPLAIIEKTYEEVWTAVNTVDEESANGTAQDPYIIDLGGHQWGGVGN